MRGKWIIGLVLAILGYVVLREWGMSAPAAVLLEGGVVMLGVMIWSVFYAEQVEMTAESRRVWARSSWLLGGLSLGLLGADAGNLLPVHLSPVSRILGLVAWVTFAGLALGLQQRGWQKYAGLAAVETLAVLVFLWLPGGTPWSAWACLSQEMPVVRAETLQACNTVCTWWVPKPCGGYNDAGNYVSCNAAGIDQNGQPCLGCCFAQTVVCDTPTPEPPTPVPSATRTPTATLSPTVPRTSTPAASATPTPTSTLRPTWAPIFTLTDTPEPSATLTATFTVPPTETPTPTASDTPTPTATETPLPLPGGTETPTPTVTEMPTPLPSATPLPTLTGTPTPAPIPTQPPLPTATPLSPIGTATDSTAMQLSPTPAAPLPACAPLPTPTPTSGDGSGQSSCSTPGTGENPRTGMGTGEGNVLQYPHPAIVQGGDGYPAALQGEYYLLPGGFQPPAQCPVGYTPLYIRVFVDVNQDGYMSPQEGVSHLQVFVLSTTYDRLGYTWTVDGQGLFCLTPTQYNTRVYLDVPYLLKFGAIDVPEAPEGFVEVWFRLESPVLPLYLP